MNSHILFIAARLLKLRKNFIPRSKATRNLSFSVNGCVILRYGPPQQIVEN